MEKIIGLINAPFTPFNADGSVNKDKLSMALYIDDMSGRDGYSMISLLSEHGVHLVDQNMLNNYTKEFETSREPLDTFYPEDNEFYSEYLEYDIGESSVFGFAPSAFGFSPSSIVDGF